MKTKQIGNFLESMMGAIDRKEIELYKKLVDGSQIENIDDHEEFFFGVLYPFEQFVSGLIKTEIADNRDVVFLLKNQQFIERNFLKLIQQKEGFPCSADKSRTILKRLLDYYINGDEIVFDYDAEYTYHLPKKIFTTHDEIINFYTGLKGLFSGNYEKYLEGLKEILENGEKE